MKHNKLLEQLGFLPKENTSGVYHKKYTQCDGYSIEINVEKEAIDYGDKIVCESKTTQNFAQEENWVVLECVNRLLEKGYQPQNIILEKTWSAGHGTSGRLDICVTQDDGSEYLLIECKTYGKEFDKEFTRMKKDGGQLFTYFKFSNKADVIMLYASELRGNEVIYKNEIVEIEEEYRSGDVKDFYSRWSKLTKDNGVFEPWIVPYCFESKALTINDLEEIKQEDSSFIFNRFLEILRHNVVSDKGNAFNRIFTLFLCKIYDEKTNEETNNELGFQWFNSSFEYEGRHYPKDDHRSFQIRLTDLYKNGMYEFLEKVVTDFSETEFNNRFHYLSEDDRRPILDEFKKIRLEKNNEFAIKDVYDAQSFDDNAVVVKEIVELLQGYKLRYTKKQQYLSDFFELLLTTGLKQESGQFFTPVPVAQFIIKSLPLDSIVEDKLSSARIDNDTLLPYVIDYAAGSGHFITEVMHEIQRLINSKDDKKYAPSIAKKIRSWQDDHFSWAMNYVYGIEKDYRLVKVGKVGCYLHGDGLANVIHSDGLARFSHPDYKGKLATDLPKKNQQFDVIVSNPPYSVSAFRNNASKYYNEADFDLYHALTDSSSEIECLFIERAQQLLKEGGVAGIILPSSILSNSGIYSKSREIILQYFEIVAITELGSNTFMATGTNTVILFLRRRSNYDHINLKQSVKTFFTSLQDVTINGIEKPIAQYVDYVWEGISFTDYLTLLQTTPNSVIEEHELYKEYRKKIKAKNEKEFWYEVLTRENEKLYYFIITYSQKIVLVKSGEKNEEKRFLGYEFSNRRGSEGIHPIQRGKLIDECTQLFDPNVFDNPEKASTYVYKAFKGDFNFPIDEAMKKNVFHANLVDMLTFDRVDFEKNISLAIKKKVKVESKWEIVKLEDVIELISGQSPESKFYNQDKKGIPFYQGKIEFGDIHLNEPVYWTEKITKESIKGDVLITVRAPVGPVNINPFSTICIGRGLNALRASSKISNIYLFYYLRHNQELINGSEGAIFQSISREQILSIRIPLPPKEIQEKIVEEIEKLEEQDNKAIAEIESLKEKIENLILGVNVDLITLDKVAPYINESVKLEDIALNTYVTTDNMLQNKLGIVPFSGRPNITSITKFKSGDILISNIRPYLKKIWFSNTDGGCSKDVLVFRTLNEALYLPKYIYFLLRRDPFFDYVMQDKKGVKMPRGDKRQIMKYMLPIPSYDEQQKIVSEIEKIEEEIAILEKQLANIPKQNEAILNKYLLMLQI